MTCLSLSLLGPFQATLGGEPVNGFESNKVRALLAYLAVEAHHLPKGHPRPVLAGLLWPEKPEPAALANLRNALANPRDTIGDRLSTGADGGRLDERPFLKITRRTIRFDPASDHRLDVAEFQTLAESSLREIAAASPAFPDAETYRRLQEAVALYRGDFLQGFGVRDGLGFEEWALLQRERLHALALEALGALGEYHEDRGAYRDAIACSRQQTAIEPWHEEAHRRWMRALAAGGNRGMALAQYATCRQVLADELGIEPDPATTGLYEQIRDGTLWMPQRVASGGHGSTPVRVGSNEAPPDPEPTLAPGMNRVLPVDTSLDGEQRRITVVRAEICGSADLLARGKSRARAGLVERIRNSLADEALRFGGNLLPYDGDGLVVSFGDTVAHEDDPERAVLAALAMQAEFGTQMPQWTRAYPDCDREDTLSLRSVVDTGLVVVTETKEGILSDAAMQEVLACGSPMETIADPGSVIVSETTHRLVEPLFDWSLQGEIDPEAGGRASPVYRALGRKANSSKMRGIEGLSSPLIGRDTELQALQAAIERLQSGVGGIVTLVGEAGLGKSRLVAETRALIAGRSSGATFLHPTSPRWVEGRCLSYETHVVYHVWADLLCGLLELDGDASQATADRLLERVRALCSERVDEIYPFLAHMISLPLNSAVEARLRGIEAEGLKVLTYAAVERVFERVAEQSPLVVVCEDLHWADRTSVDLLSRLFSLTDRMPILWVCVFRPETEHDCWRIREIAARSFAHRHTDLWLNPLSAGESSQLVACLLAIEDLPGTLRSRILERAEGNPFYVEEIVRSLIDDGVIAYKPVEGRWQMVREASDSALPDTLRGVMMARVDRLPRESRQVLQLAAVIGRIFSHRVMEAICSRRPVHEHARSPYHRADGPGVGATLDAHLVFLQRVQMIREQRRVPDAKYAFKHQLILEAVYESLPLRKRRALHRRVAEVLQGLYPDLVEEQLGLLAHHWERAGDIDRAIVYLRRAGERAAAQFANAEAVAYLSRAIDLVRDGDQATRYALLLAREQVYDVQGAREAQERDLNALSGAAVSNKQRAEVAWRRARYAEMISDHRGAIAAARVAVRLAQSARDVASEAHARFYWSQALTYLDRHKEAWAQCEQVLALAESEGLGSIEALSLQWLGRIAMFTEDAAGSKVYLNQALDLLRQAGDRRGQGIVLLSLCSACRRLAEYTRCRAYGEQALELLRETGERREEGWALVELGRACNTERHYAAAKGYWDQALIVFVETRARRGEAWVREYLASLARLTGQGALARAYLEQSLPVFRQANEPRSMARVLAWLGLLSHRLGDSTAGLAHLREALSLGKRIGVLRLQALSHTFLGTVLADLRQFSQARAAFKLARQGFEGLHLAAMPLVGLANVHLAQGDLAGALSHVEVVLEIAENLSDLGHLWESPSIFLSLYRVLEANSDPRAAVVLETAHRVLLSHADGFGSGNLRRLFLENVPANREIVALWEQGVRP